MPACVRSRERRAKVVIILDQRMAGRQCITVDYFHLMRDCPRNAHHAAPGTPPRHAFQEPMSKLTTIKVVQPQVVVQSQRSTRAVLVALTQSQPLGGIDLNVIRNQADVIVHAYWRLDAKVGARATIGVYAAIQFSCRGWHLAGSRPGICEQILRRYWRVQAGTKGHVLAIFADCAGM